MKKLLLFLILCNPILKIAGQQTDTLDSFMRYVDFHIHPTYKHYFRPKAADSMKIFLAISEYDRDSNVLRFLNPKLRESLKKINWVKYKTNMPVTGVDPLRNGLTSDLRNYDQSSYSEIMFLPGSILCNSYSPYEKQFVLVESQRRISSLLVTKMGIDRLRSYADDNHTPLNDFFAEYFYNLMQQEEMFIRTSYPKRLYDTKDTGYYQNPPYLLSIKMVKDSLELDNIVKQNDVVFRNWDTTQPPPHLVTPMVMSIEGGQVLYDKLSSLKQHILNPLNYTFEKKKLKEFFTGVSNDSLKEIHAELRRSVSALRNLHHRLFFITLGHFAENHVVGYAKTLDRDPENFQHRALSGLTIFRSINDKLNKKGYSGFNPGINMSSRSVTPDSIGFKVVEAFLDPDSSHFKKPTYIDVKHMDIQARIQYYYMRRKYEQKFNIRIPIIASHFGVSGETQAMAAATGLWPNSDKYKEIERVRHFYKKKILKGYRKEARYRYWTEKVMGAPDSTSKNDISYYSNEVLDPFDRAMYRPLDFNDDSILKSNRVYDPFVNYKLDNQKVGWYYPWSLNLFDEEIIEINKSDGIIGLLFDPRQLGAFMPKYRNYHKKYKTVFEKLKSSLTDQQLSDIGLLRDDLLHLEYLKLEPLIRNLFYIVQIVRQRQKEEQFFRDIKEDIEIMRKTYSNYIADKVYTDKNAWGFVSIGSDFDGLIDPIDFAPTASYIPLLRRRMIVYAWMFAQIHSNLFKDPLNNDKPFISDLDDSKMKMHKFFYENGQKFILKYF